MGENLIQMEREKRGVDPEKFMSYIRSKIIDGRMYYLLLDEIQMLDCFGAVLNRYLRKDNMDVYVTGNNSHLVPLPFSFKDNASPESKARYRYLAAMDEYGFQILHRLSIVLGSSFRALYTHL